MRHFHVFVFFSAIIVVTNDVAAEVELAVLDDVPVLVSNDKDDRVAYIKVRAPGKEVLELFIATRIVYEIAFGDTLFKYTDQRAYDIPENGIIEIQLDEFDGCQASGGDVACGDLIGLVDGIDFAQSKVFLLWVDPSWLDIEFSLPSGKGILELASGGVEFFVEDPWSPYDMATVIGTVSWGVKKSSFLP